MKTVKKKAKSRLPHRVLDLLSELPLLESAKITVDEISEKLGVHRSHLSRSYREVYGKNLESFLIDRRLMLSITYLLGNPEMTVKEISKIFGYCRCDYYTRLFKEQYGITPGKYREIWLLKKRKVLK